MKKIVLAALFSLPAAAAAEQMTLTTYYPAPYGGYVSLLTTSNTYLSRDAGFTVVGSAGDSDDRLFVFGNTKLDDLYFKNAAGVYVKFPRPPSGKTLAWETVTLGSEADTYQNAGNAYHGTPHGDTCDGNTAATYSCPNGLKKECVDVKISAYESCPYIEYDGGVDVAYSDTCDGNKAAAYSACNKSCRDILKANPDCPALCNHKRREITFTPRYYQDVRVVCGIVEQVTVLVAR